MARPKSNQPTVAELEILNVLWEGDRGTANEIVDRLQKKKDVTYSSISKILHVMVDKKLVTRTKVFNSQVYQANVKQKSTQKKLLVDFVQRTFGGSFVEMTVNAFESQMISEEELKRINARIKELRKQSEDPTP